MSLTANARTPLPWCVINFCNLLSLLTWVTILQTMRNNDNGGCHLELFRPVVRDLLSDRARHQAEALCYHAERASRDRSLIILFRCGSKQGHHRWRWTRPIDGSLTHIRLRNIRKGGASCCNPRDGCVLRPHQHAIKCTTHVAVTPHSVPPCSSWLCVYYYQWEVAVRVPKPDSFVNQSCPRPGRCIRQLRNMKQTMTRLNVKLESGGPGRIYKKSDPGLISGSKSRRARHVWGASLAD